MSAPASPRSASGTTSSNAVGRRNGCSEPVCTRLMSSRLLISPSSRSEPSSIVASKVSSSSADHFTSSWRRLEIAALIDASGVRRSWLTAVSSAVRTRLASPSASAWAAWVRSRSRSRAAAAWAPMPSSTRRLIAGGSPVRRSRRSGRSGSTVTDSLGLTASALIPLLATSTQRPAVHSSSSARVAPLGGQLREHRGRGIGAGQHGAGEVEQRAGVGRASDRLRRPPGRQVHDAADAHRDRDEQQQGQQVLRLLDGQGVQRRGQVPVQQQALRPLPSRRPARTRRRPTPPRRPAGTAADRRRATGCDARSPEPG